MNAARARGGRQRAGAFRRPGVAGSRPPRSSRIPITALLSVAVFVLVADVISKVIVVADLSGHAPIRLLGGLLTLRLIRNSGAAFSIGTP